MDRSATGRLSKETPLSQRICKSIDKLRAKDFDAHPCWEYALDEEDADGKDECTVRPLDVGARPSREDQTIVQAVFFFSNGRIRPGCVTLNAGGDPSGHQPVVFLGKRKALHFYNGAIEPGKADIRVFRKALAKVCDAPGPIRYVSTVLTPEGRPLAFGELSGLYWMADWRTQELRSTSGRSES